MITTAALFLSAAMAGAPAADLVPKECGNCERWNKPIEPFRIAPNTWYIGPEGLSVLMVKTPDGLVVFDAGLAQSVPLIEANLKTLGFSVTDIKLILNSHAHFDHAGGIAALSRLSGAPVLTRELGAAALRRGNTAPGDPQAGWGEADNAYPPVAGAAGLADGEVIEFGGVSITSHDSSGHTPGGTSYSWRDCDDAGCVDVVYADSITAVSAPEFRFNDSNERVADFRQTIDRIAALPCDVLVSTHPEFSGLLDKRDAPGGLERFIDRAACRTYADTGREKLRQKLVDEAAAESCP